MKLPLIIFSLMSISTIQASEMDLIEQMITSQDITVATSQDQPENAKEDSNPLKLDQSSTEEFMNLEFTDDVATNLSATKKEPTDYQSVPIPIFKFN